MMGHHLRGALFLAGLGASCAIGLLTAPDAHAHMYFNSSEPGCDGSDPTIIWCDDFEDGAWVVTDCDHGGPSDPANDGWCGTIYSTPDPQGTNYGRCGNLGAAGTSCSASKASTGARNEFGIHAFNVSGVTDFYYRYYYYADPGSYWNHEKMLGFGVPGGNANEWGFLDMAFTGRQPSLYINPPEDAWQNQNQGSNLIFQGGNWYYIEVHLRLNTPGSANGIYELWADNCGANGLGCTGAGTLRARHTDVMYRAAGNTQTIGTLWLLNWSPTAENGAQAPYSSGDRRYDQIVAATRRIGPMANGTPPPQGPPAAPVLLN